jgi:hypothetical protein
MGERAPRGSDGPLKRLTPAACVGACCISCGRKAGLAGGRKPGEPRPFKVAAVAPTAVAEGPCAVCECMPSRLPAPACGVSVSSEPAAGRSPAVAERWAPVVSANAGGPPEWLLSRARARDPGVPVVGPRAGDAAAAPGRANGRSMLPPPVLPRRRAAEMRCETINGLDPLPPPLPPPESAEPGRPSGPAMAGVWAGAGEWGPVLLPLPPAGACADSGVPDNGLRILAGAAPPAPPAPPIPWYARTRAAGPVTELAALVWPGPTGPRLSVCVGDAPDTGVEGPSSENDAGPDADTGESPATDLSVPCAASSCAPDMEESPVPLALRCSVFRTARACREGEAGGVPLAAAFNPPPPPRAKAGTPPALGPCGTACAESGVNAGELGDGDNRAPGATAKGRSACVRLRRGRRVPPTARRLGVWCG